MGVISFKDIKTKPDDVTTAPAKMKVVDDSSYMEKYYTSGTPVTDGIVWSPAAGKRWHVTDLIISVDTACIVTLEDDLAGGDEVRLKLDLAANSGICKKFNVPLHGKEDASDLVVTTSAGAVYITATGYEI